MIIVKDRSYTPLEKSISLQALQILPAPHDKLARFGKNYARIIKCRMHRHHSLRVMPEQICNRDLLAKVVRENYGFGMFYVMFFVKWTHFKTYRHDFTCRGPSLHAESLFWSQRWKGCPYYGTGKCRKWRRTPYKIGMKCKKNRAYGPNWQVRAQIEIKERYENTPTHGQLISENADFIYLWYRRKDKMARFKWWQSQYGRRMVGRLFRQNRKENESYSEGSSESLFDTA